MASKMTSVYRRSDSAWLGIVDAEDEPAPSGPGGEPVVIRSPGGPDVEEAAGGGGDAGDVSCHRMTPKWTAGESHPDFRPATAASSCSTSSPWFERSSWD